MDLLDFKKGAIKNLIKKQISGEISKETFKKEFSKKQDEVYQLEQLKDHDQSKK